MEKNHLKNSIAYLFLVIFISMKMTGLHALTHTDHKDHSQYCTICLHTVKHSSTPAQTPASLDYTIENNEYITQREINETYTFIASIEIAPDQLFSRPPPFLQ